MKSVGCCGRAVCRSEASPRGSASAGAPSTRSPWASGPIIRAVRGRTKTASLPRRACRLDVRAAGARSRCPACCATFGAESEVSVNQSTGRSKRSAFQPTSARIGGRQRAASSARLVARLASSAAGGEGWFSTTPAMGSPSPNAAAAIRVCSVWLIVPARCARPPPAENRTPRPGRRRTRRRPAGTSARRRPRQG